MNLDFSVMQGSKLLFQKEIPNQVGILSVNDLTEPRYPIIRLFIPIAIWRFAAC
jgi:hypothetical protein